jgi:hypothetical protein
MRKKIGRPTKLNPATEKRLLEALRDGATYKAACAHAGIDYKTFRSWILRGEEKKSGKFRRFLEAVEKAEHEAEMKCIKAWVSKIDEDWRAAKEFLERRFPEEWGKSVAITQEAPFRIILEEDAPDSEEV